ncbi:receptor kinase-like protein Xa21 [Ipomoea triloba]|uniref:receptor kinase-like protein Xa21 n=1 Tax=Ipomoea triloba TaxID=35885 RepID=UPI00125D19F7|nr:receptor kinase-like protein Xa21 [Ipomoea triloba]
MGDLNNLQYLYLGENNLIGSIPSRIFNISGLYIVSLEANNLSGKILSSLEMNVPTLIGISVALNKLSGNMPSFLVNASKLEFLDISVNEFSGFIPSSLGDLRSLESLNLEGNNLHSPLSSRFDKRLSFISSLTKCRKLRKLSFSENYLNGILPSSIGNFSSELEILGLGGCEIMGSIPPEIGNLSNILILHLEENNLEAFIPTSMKRLSKVQILALHGNKLQGSIPLELCYLLNLGKLDLQSNRLNGKIPDCLGNITSLRYFYLNSNNLTSTIPVSLWSLKDLLELDLSSNSINGLLSFEIGNLKSLILMDLSANQIMGNIPSTLGALQMLQNLSLANNHLQGLIPKSLGNMLNLVELDLSLNNLLGEIPKSFEKLLHLKLFNVSYNKLSGEVPSGGPFANFTNQSFMSNQALCGPPWFHQCTTTHHLHKVKRKYIFISVFVFLSISTMAIVVIIVFQRRKKRTNKSFEIDLPSRCIHPRISYYDLQRMTNDFSDSNLLGKGSFSSVYKGILSSGTSCAIKVFDMEIQGALKSFDVECEVMRNLRHRNLVQVISSCSNLDFKALVLGYMPNGSLDNWLHSNENLLDICQRLDIMIDVASALEYLHHDYFVPVVHCDLKPSNILLNEEMVGHVSDFGIAKFLDDEQSMAHTKTLPTFGYIAPEYGSQGLVSIRSDVYSYGVVLIETFTRMKPSDNIFSGNSTLKRLVESSLPNAITQVIDLNLLPQDQIEIFTKHVECVTSIMKVALRCCEDAPEERISMKDVLVALKKIKLQFLGRNALA